MVDAAEEESVQELLLLVLDFNTSANATETGGVLGQVSTKTETGTLKVAALSPEAVEASGDSVVIPAGDTGAKVEVPADLLFQAAELSQEAGVSGPVLLSLTSMSEETANSFVDPRNEGQLTASLQSQPLSINLRSPDGTALELGQLRTPLEFVLKANPNASCAYWDEAESRWSEEGLEKVLHDTPGEIKCLTSHLSIFAAVFHTIWDTAVSVLQCSSAWVLMSEKGFQKLIAPARQWMTSSPAISVFVVIGLFLLVQSRAAYVDRQAERMVPWEEVEAVLLRDKVVDDTPEDTYTYEEVPRRRGRARAACCSGVTALKEWCCWCAGICFGVENILTVVTEMIPNAPEASVNRCIRSLHAHRSGVAADSLEILVNDGDKFHLQEDSEGRPVQVSRSNARRSRFSAVVHEMGRNLGEFAAAARNLSARWNVHLHGAGAVQSMLKRQWCVRICLLFPAFHPWVALLRYSIITPRKVRAALIFLKLCTAGATNALFFTGTTPGPDDDPSCRQKGNFLQTLTRNSVVGFLSAFLGDCIIFTLFLVQARKVVEKEWTDEIKAWQRSIWRCRRTCFWLLWLTYTIATLCYVMLFLANMRLQDAHDWIVATAVSLLQDLVLLPAAVALVLGTLATCALQSRRIRKNIEDKWLEKKEQQAPEPVLEPDTERRLSIASSQDADAELSSHATCVLGPRRIPRRPGSPVGKHIERAPEQQAWIGILPGTPLDGG